MARGYGQRVPGVVRRRGIRALQSLLAAGADELEAREQVAERFNVSTVTADRWMKRAYDELSIEANASRAELLGVALRRRRFAMARSAKDGDWRTYLAAADSEAKLLGLNAPVQTEHHVLIDQVQNMSKAMVDVVKDYFADDPIGRARFVSMFRARVNAQLTARPDKAALVIDVENADVVRVATDEVAGAKEDDSRVVAEDPGSAMPRGGEASRNPNPA